MGQTPIYNLPWPEAADPPDGPKGFRDLATATETALTTSTRGVYATFTTSGVSVPSGTGRTAIHWDQPLTDPLNMLNADDNAVVTAPQDGFYYIHAHINWSDSGWLGSTYRLSWIMINNSDGYANNWLDKPSSTVTYSTQNVSCGVALSAGDTIRIYAQQTTGYTVGILGSQADTTLTVFALPLATTP